MSNPIDFSSDDEIVWRKRIRLSRSTIARFEEAARQERRRPEAMVAYLIEEFLRRGEKAAQND